MKFIADLHIHSPFSRATSKSSTLKGLASWAAIKGVTVLGTGDFTHPGWFSMLTEQLEEAEPGFFKFKEKITDFSDVVPDEVVSSIDLSQIRFVLTAEISSIYKKHERVRKNHNIVFVPSFDNARKINRALAEIGNLQSDGRPILGLDARNLLEIVLENSPEGFLVPAHIWTPWFSLFGSKSGFDCIDECFEDLTPYIFALETGLSSDPAMNRHISALDNYTLISNSDCHSPSKIGREANIFTTEFDFFHMRDAIKRPFDSNGNQLFAATVEFYPEEGKYHCDGHRKCKVCMEPHETKANNGICPQCNKPVTVGVLNRVMELADRNRPQYPQNAPDVYSCIPLTEILSELLGVGPATKKVAAAYNKLISLFGSEFSVLLDIPVDELGSKSNPLIGEAIQRVRSNKVIRKPGYDGEFGVIRVFEDGEREKLGGQLSMFAPLKRMKKKQENSDALPLKAVKKITAQKPDKPTVLNNEQKKSVEDNSKYIAVKAGPGTGKTHTLIYRVIRIVQEQKTNCTVISFTNKAVSELTERIAHHVEKNDKVSGYTFHGYCLHWLRKKQPDLKVIGPDTRACVLFELFPEYSSEEMKKISEQIQGYFDSPGEKESLPVIDLYLTAGKENKYIDLENIIPLVTDLLRADPQFSRQVQRETGPLLVDEFQDINRDQYDLICELAKLLPVYIIGDPDQAIYGFRGANAGWFEAFIASFNAHCHYLVRNYRNGSTIIEAAEQVILCNHNRIKSEAMVPGSPKNSKGKIYQCLLETPLEEASWIGKRIEELIGGSSHRETEQLVPDQAGHYSLKNIGILVRTTRQMRIIGNHLQKKGLPFQTVDLKAFYTHGDCRLIYLWILLVAGYAELDEAIYLFNKHKEVESSKAHKVFLYFASLKNSLNETLSLGIFPDSDASIQAELSSFSKVYQQLVTTSRVTDSVTAVIDKVIELHSLDATSREIKSLTQLSISYATSLQSFAQYLKKYSDSVVYDEQAECISLSTLHAAKGLEFDVVFIAGANEGFLPLRPREAADKDLLDEYIEEERRLFYVGMTRTIDILHISYVKKHIGANQEETGRFPSRFIREIPVHLFSPLSKRATRKKSQTKKQLTLFK